MRGWPTNRGDEDEAGDRGRNTEFLQEETERTEFISGREPGLNCELTRMMTTIGVKTKGHENPIFKTKATKETKFTKGEVEVEVTAATEHRCWGVEVT
jgi:hypothetical protein